jgi:hypothetical protein
MLTRHRKSSMSEATVRDYLLDFKLKPKRLVARITFRQFLKSLGIFIEFVYPFFSQVNLQFLRIPSYNPCVL